MRLILVEHGCERVCGDSAAFAARSPEWAENTFQKPRVARLSVLAARLLDESEGRFRWNYQFAHFGPFEPGGGYDVFACAADLDEAPCECFREMPNVLRSCFYVGFVRCLKPAIPFDRTRRNPASRATSAPDHVQHSKARKRAAGE